jgi:hypothetical protein
MALFIAKTDGTTDFEVGLVELDLISISKIDSGLGFEENATVDIEGVTCIPVTYTESETGPTPDRLNDMVNKTDFPNQSDVVIFGVDCAFLLSDGSSECGNGVSIESPANSPVYSTSGNPFTATIAIFYDVTYCDGAGMIVDKEGGGHTAQYSDVVLYHEMSHAFHFLSNTQDPDLAQEEVNAETDENDMRDVRGVPHRDAHSHWGDCGGGDTGCCIVATLSTGSAFSSEVNRFRHLRDHVLRRSAVGDNFFAEFFYRYYGFSPEVTLLIGRQPNLGPLVRDYFVMPLLAGCELLIYYAENKGRGLAEFLREQATREALAPIYEERFLNELAGYLTIGRNFDRQSIAAALSGKGNEYAGFQKLLKHIRRETVKDEYIEWTLISVVEVWLESARQLGLGKTDAEIDRAIYEKIINWIAHMPISDIWGEFSRIETENELNALEQFIFDRRSKEIYSARLIAKHPMHSETIRRWAERRDYA